MANTHTNLDAVIFAKNTALEAFYATLLPLGVFSTSLSSEIINKPGDTVKVYSLGDVADAALDKAEGADYVMQDQSDSGIDLVIDKHKYVSWGLTDAEISRMAFDEIKRWATAKGQKLAEKVILDILSLVTAANYDATAVLEIAADSFDSDEVIDVNSALSSAHWPAGIRNLVLNGAFAGALKKDPAIKNASSFGSNESLKYGIIPNFGGFNEIFESQIVPANGENLAGFACLPSAMLFASRYLMPEDPNVMMRAEPLVHKSGLTLGLKKWYEPKSEQTFNVLEIRYGRRVYNSNALRRIVTPA